jgi:transposase
VDPGVDLDGLTHAQKDALIRELAARLQSALARIAELEAQLNGPGKPPKNPQNSSTPPSKGAKPALPPSKNPQRKSRPGIGRPLAENPDRVVEAFVDTCPHCAAVFQHSDQTPQAVYDRIELPPIKPDITRVHLFGGCCACCGERATATAPAGLEPGSPFGRSVAALVVYLHYAQAIGIERLALLMAEIFGLSISEGALINILRRAKPKLEVCGEAIANQVRAADVVCSDETSVRVCGRNWWEWVFVTSAAVLHLIRPSRGRCVPREVFGQEWQGVWVSDAYCSQRGNAATWQMCLAHLLRDTQYVIECGDTQFSRCFKKLLLRAIIIGRRRPDLDDAQLAQHYTDLHRRLDRIVDCTPASPEARRLHRRLIRDRKHLFVFVTDRRVPPTNNISERHLRPSVTFRKVTNGFRAEWGSETYAAFRTIASTARHTGKTVLQAIQDALAPEAKTNPG